MIFHNIIIAMKEENEDFVPIQDVTPHAFLEPWPYASPYVPIGCIKASYKLSIISPAHV